MKGLIAIILSTVLTYSQIKLLAAAAGNSGAALMAPWH
jgi:hypothetical protein